MLEQRELTRGQRLALKVAEILYRHKKADPEAVWELSKTHKNPPYISDLFDDSASVNEHRIWPVALINGSGRVAQAPRGEAASIDVEGGYLKLRVFHDGNFDRKTQNMFDEPAAEAYNNAHLEGLRGFLPTPGEDVVYACDMRVSGLQGTTGIWVEEAETFNPVTGIMEKPFRSFGFSWAGDNSANFIRGLSRSESVV